MADLLNQSWKIMGQCQNQLQKGRKWTRRRSDSAAAVLFSSDIRELETVVFSFHKS